MTACAITPDLATGVTDVVCPDGWEKCRDGTCEPFHFLCTEHDGSPPLTTRSHQTTTRMVQGTNTTIVNILFTPAGTTSPPTTDLVTQPSSTTTTTSSVPLTASNGQCPDGFVTCNDGTCEPFAFNCNETGLTEVTFPTWEPVTTFTSKLPGTSIVTNVSKVTSGVSGTAVASTTFMGNVTGTVSSASVVSSTTSMSSITVGQCPSGFFTCSDGTCEPFESNCDETGSVTGTFPTKDPMVSTATPGVTSGATNSKNVSMTTGVNIATGGTMSTEGTTQAGTTSNPTTTTTATVAAVTDSSGNEVCKDGWELCPDGSCEPFHFLCLEHSSGSGSSLIG